jgi:hypothetical protein
MTNALSDRPDESIYIQKTKSEVDILSWSKKDA